MATTHPRWALVGLCMLFNLIDGLDVMAMAFTASSVAAEWGLSGAQTGLLLSAGLVGMALGSVLAAPIVARYGRRRMLLGCLALSGTSMLLAGQAAGFDTLLCLRGLTGVGVGAILVTANVATYEHASAQWRGLAIALQSVAFCLGAVLCGLLAQGLTDHVGWRPVFLAGGAITLAACAIAALYYHEPHPEGGRQALRAPRYGELFRPGHWQRTARLAAVCFLLMFSFYFVMSWTPSLLVHNGFSTRNGAAGGILLNLGGMLGALLVGLGANRFGFLQLLLACLLVNALLMLALVPLTALPSLAALAACLAGLLLNGAVAALYSLAAHAFADPLRASGVGLMLATGRLGAILSPAVAGLLLDIHWQPQALFAFFAASLVLAAGLAWHSGARVHTA